MSGEMTDRYTAADAFTDALVRSGVEYIFSNSGTDYPNLIETWAKYKKLGKKIPEIIICPHEMVAMSAAQGYAQITGKPAGVFVHVDVGTQNVGCALSNAFRARVPMLFMAGMSPYTTDGELPGSRDNYIQFLQNTNDQKNIVREYVKHIAEIRSGANIQKILYRALQLTMSEVQAPVYITVPREVFAEDGVDYGPVPDGWQKVEPVGIDPESLDVLAEALTTAKSPLILVSYAGRQKEAVAELVKLCEKLAIAVVETMPAYVNFPGDHPLHLGFDQAAAMKESDLVIAIDNDVPWLPAKMSVTDGCRLFFIDRDPVKEDIPLWHYPVERYIRADSLVALRQLNAALDSVQIDEASVKERFARISERHRAIREAVSEKEKPQGKITAEYLCACVREVISEDAILVNETITNNKAFETTLRRNLPGTRIHSCGSGLGYSGGAAIGAKLAAPDKDVIVLTGDGSYVFSCPTAVYWSAAKYGTPFMTIVFNNGGWIAPTDAVKSQHPDGYSVNEGMYWNSFEPSPEYEKIAEAAGGAFGAKVSDPSQLKCVLEEGLAAVHSGRCAVINVVL